MVSGIICLILPKLLLSMKMIATNLLFPCEYRRLTITNAWTQLDWTWGRDLIKEPMLRNQGTNYEVT